MPHRAEMIAVGPEADADEDPGDGGEEVVGLKAGPEDTVTLEGVPTLDGLLVPQP